MKKFIILIVSCITMLMQSIHSAENSVSKVPSLKNLAIDALNKEAFIKKKVEEEQIKITNLPKFEFICAPEQPITRLQLAEAGKDLENFRPTLSLFKSCNYHRESAALRAKFIPGINMNIPLLSDESQQRVEEVAFLIDRIQQPQKEKNFEKAVQETFKMLLDSGDAMFKKLEREKDNTLRQAHYKKLQDNNLKIKMLTHAHSNPKEFVLDNDTALSFHLIRFGDSKLIKFYQQRFPRYFGKKISIPKSKVNQTSSAKKTATIRISPYAFALCTAQSALKKTPISADANFQDLKERIAIANILNPHKCSYLEDLDRYSIVDRIALNRFAEEKIRFIKKLQENKNK